MKSTKGRPICLGCSRGTGLIVADGIFNIQRATANSDYQFLRFNAFFMYPSIEMQIMCWYRELKIWKSAWRRGQYLGVEVGALLHQGSNGEPERVGQGKLVLDHVVLELAGVRIVPLVGREAGHDKHGY